MSETGAAYRRADPGPGFLDWSVAQLLRNAVAEVPDQVALILPSAPGKGAARSWTYRELLAVAEQSARALLDHFDPGDRVATWAGSSAEVLQLHLGAALAGIVLVTLNPANRAGELQYLLVQSEASGLVLDRTWRKQDNARAIEGLLGTLPALRKLIYVDEWDSFIRAATSSRPLPAVTADAPALILFTSGTTGKPKAAVLHHCGIVNNARLSTSRLQVRQGSVWLNLLPMFHVGGSVTMTLGCLANHGTQVLLPEFNAEQVLDLIGQYHVNVTMAVPTMLTLMLEHERMGVADLSSLEVVVTGGTMVAPELVRAVKQHIGAEVMVMFGQTEAGGAMCLTQRDDDIERVTGSVGAALAGSEIKVISPTTQEVLPIGTIGEICVRTRCAMTGYFRNPEKTTEVIDSEGWVHTTDLGFMKPDGYMQVTGRLKDMIIRGGENIYPREIEDALAEHPAVSQAAVFGVPDLKWGEQVAAAIVLKPGSSTDGDALSAFLQERIARHKVPKFWQFVAAMPLNASGKIQKFKLRESFQEAQPSQPGGA